MHNPNIDHWMFVKHICRYLVSTIVYGLLLSKSNNLNVSVYCDADLGGA